MSPLRLNFDAEIVQRLPRLSLENIRKVAGRKHAEQRQRALIDLGLDAFRGNLPDHLSGVGFSISYEDLQNRFGRFSDSMRLQNLLSILFDTDGEYDTGITRSYRLRSSVHMAYQVVVTDDPHTRWLVVEAASGREVVLSKDRSGSSEVFVPEVIEITYRQLLQALVEIDRLINERGPDALYEEGSSLTLGDVKQRHLHPLAAWQASAGGISNRYILGHDGRLYAEAGAPHIVVMPRVVRALLLKGTGLVDLDIVNCGPSLLQSLAHGHGIATPVLDSYINNRDGWILSLQHHTGESRDDIKTALLALMNGGGIDSDAAEHARVGTDMDAPSIPKAYRDFQPVLDLQEELSETFRLLFANHISDTYNALGLELSVKDRDTRERRAAKAGDWRAKRRHVIVGLEQLAIRILCRSLGADVVAVIFDGVVCTPGAWTVSALEEAVERVSYELLGFPLKVRLKAKAF